MPFYGKSVSLDALNDISTGSEETPMKSLRNPTKLKPMEKGNLVQVIVETPAGCRNKYSFDVEQGIFAHKKTLPAGMSFPYNFGFLPQTMAPDGDPIDVLLLMDEPAFPGISVRGRLIGVIEGQQVAGKKKIRNDRLIVVAEATHRYENVRKLRDLPDKWTNEVQEFFVNYHDLEGKKYQLLGTKGASEALRLIRKARRAAE
jgi:inorganic pyrophosphatase